MSTYLLSCGGTGGHLAPGIALAQGLIEHGHTVRLLISEKRVDARLIQKYPNLPFERVPGAGFSLNPVKLARCLAGQWRGLRFCRRLVRETRPDAVIGFGGFTSTSIVIAARLAGVPVALHEANRVPGKAIRTLGRYAQRVFLPPEVQLAAVPANAIRQVGLPVRPEIQRLPQAVARGKLGVEPDQKLVVVFGGSQGATVLNEWARNEFPALADAGIQVLCITGMDKGRDGFIELKTKAGASIRAYFLEFCDDVAALLSAADLVVARAGAGTIAELIRCEIPAVLVPFPHAADDHQRANAAYFARQGGGVALEQTKISELRATVIELLSDEGKMAELHRSLQRMNEHNPIETLMAEIDAMVRETKAASGLASVAKGS